MLDDFLLRAGLAGVGVALATGPLGSFVVWRRMAYFGDATAHAAILGVALALALDLPVVLGTLVMAAFVGWAVAALAARGRAVDMSLIVIAYGALAAGLVGVSLAGGGRINLEAYLFGDILTVTVRDLLVIWGGAILVLGLLLWRWAALLTATLNEDLASAAGLDPARERLVLTLALAVVVAVALKVVGALLIGAMLVIPAAVAQSLARSPEAMAILAVIAGMLAVLGGLAGSYFFDTPAGPSIVVAAAVLFVASLLVRRSR
ncbi:MAG: iron chelate uptake ABC transporter family permease subunit [Rhodobacteraceae bacterium]|nr:iron chelate uptake ABC transporter family permease subunit [Paracoccaceae bacterium]